jgi:hypothetical protein
MRFLCVFKPRLLKPTLIDGARCIGRGLMEGEQSVHDFLVQEQDLMKSDKLFMRFINEQDFLSRFGNNPSVMEVLTPDGANLRRLGIVLPLHVSNKVIPIPLILDTGAPESLYLGTGAFRMLGEANLMKDVVGRWPYRLLGTLRRGEKYIEEPFVDRLPVHYEANIRGDIRLNVLGLSAIKKLDIIKY